MHDLLELQCCVDDIHPIALLVRKEKWRWEVDGETQRRLAMQSLAKLGCGKWVCRVMVLN